MHGRLLSWYQWCWFLLCLVHDLLMNFTVPLGRWILLVTPLTPCIKVLLKTGITLACPFVFFIRSDS